MESSLHGPVSLDAFRVCLAFRGALVYKRVLGVMYQISTASSLNPVYYHEFLVV